MSIPLSLSGKVALISGGSRGIGAATVRMFTAAGAKVAFSYRSARAQAEALAKECGATVCHPIVSDLNNSEAGRALVAETVRHFGRLDILVANHGVWPERDVPIERMSDEQWRSTLSINLDGVFGLVKHSVAQMKTQPRTTARRTHRTDQFH
jgi:3-oxoacyl-[acyl-carrier protein] reductase